MYVSSAKELVKYSIGVDVHNAIQYNDKCI